MDPENDDTRPLITPLSSEPVTPQAPQGSIEKIDWSTILPCMGVLVLISISTSIIKAPQTRLYESVVCLNYYKSHNSSVIGDDGNVPESLCKIPIIQGNVATIFSWQATCNLVTSLIAALYTPFVIKSKGRKFVLTVNIGCYLCALMWKLFILGYRIAPIQWTYFSSAFSLMAGGPEMRQETVFMIITTATPEENVFTVLTIGQIFPLIASFIMIRIAAWLMPYSIWIPLFVGLAIISMIIIIVWCMQIEEDSKQTTFRIKEMFGFIWSSRAILLLVLTFLGSSTFPQLIDGNVFEQYISKRLNQTIAEASKLQATSDIMNLIALIFYVVIFEKWCDSFFSRFGRWAIYLTNRFEVPQKYIFISRSAAIFQGLGFLCIGVSGSYAGVFVGLLICSAGQPLRMAIRSLLRSLIEKKDITGLFSACTVLDLIAGVAINWLITLSFKEGVLYGGIWTGLPFFCATTLLTAIAFVVFLVRIPLPENHIGSGSSTIGVESSAESMVVPDTPPEAPKSHASSVIQPNSSSS